MQDRFQSYIQSEFPELLTTRFLIAISGGLDSVVLAHLCHSLHLNFGLSHCNFQLRGLDSTRDAEFVKSLSISLECDFFIKTFQTESIAKKSKSSIQLTARKLRYDWFQELIETTSHNFLLTAHHLNDNLETFIINLSRSTGLKGLTGIPQRNGYILRPLLKFSKAELKEYAIKNNIYWREDQSNASTKYLRNEIRHKIVPSLVELNPQFLDSFESTLEKLKQTEHLIKDYTASLHQSLVSEEVNRFNIDIEKLKTYPNPQAILYQLLEGFGFTQWEDVYHLLDAQTGKILMSTSHQLVKDRNKLTVAALYTEENKPITIEESDKVVRINNSKLEFHDHQKLEETEKQFAYFDKSKLKFPLSLRPIQNGDYFYPFGMKGKKKLSDFLKDEKISPVDKSSQLVLCNYNGDIIWVLNLRTDHRYKVEENTQNILKIELKE
jgi:tRNA(Ile)-lysidine synthase